ncbi:hypothetical protein BGZ52_000573 [Haplosporangium bisporale]|nr:hypothetical protein BGZ52_000573 [Haplosporangium bisporale]
MSIAIMHKGKLVFAEGFGKRNKNDPFTPETRSMLASVTKAFTATTVGELVSEGRMDWDSTPVNTYLPEFVTHDPVLTTQLTMQDLLSHRTPFPNLDSIWMWGNETRRDLIKRIRHVPVNPKLGSILNYHNVMYSIAGEAAANVAGVPFEQLVRNKIFRPLELSSMGFSMGDMSKNPNYALPYQAVSYEDAVAGRFIELPLDGGAEKTSAAGDMYANVVDLARWGQVVMKGGIQDGKQVLRKEGIEATLSAHTIYDRTTVDPDFALSSTYGMGWLLNSYKGNNLYEHSGGHFGYITNLALFPNADLVVAHLTNSGLTNLPRPTSFHVADEILGLPKTTAWLTDTFDFEAPRGNTTAILAKLRNDLELARNQSAVPGMGVAIIHKGKLIFAEGFGKRNNKDLFTPETLSMLGSVTKAFTATAVGELVAEGKMDWDTTPVNTYLPEFETHDPVLTSQLTMQDLLSHRTPRLELIKRMRHVEVKPKMPSIVNYSNALYGVAGEAASKVAGVPYEQVVRNKVLRPLGLSSTGFSLQEIIKRPNHAVPFKAESYVDAVAGRFNQLPLDDDPANDVAAGDMYSSALDLARWGQVIMKEGMQNGKQVLSKEGVVATLTAHTIMDPAVRDPDFALSSQYGMGWMLNSYKGNNIIEHGGRTIGYMSHLALFPNAELVVAILTNADLTSLAGAATYHIADELLGLRKTHDWLNDAATDTEKRFATEDGYRKGIFPERVPNKPPAHGLSAYAGEYNHPAYGTIAVRLEGSKLHIALPTMKGVLAHYHYDSFTTVLEHTSSRMAELVTFSTGNDGKVSGISLSVFGTVVNAKRL